MLILIKNSHLWNFTKSIRQVLKVIIKKNLNFHIKITKNISMIGWKKKWVKMMKMCTPNHNNQDLKIMNLNIINHFEYKMKKKQYLKNMQVIDMIRIHHYTQLQVLVYSVNNTIQKMNNRREVILLVLNLNILKKMIV